MLEGTVRDSGVGSGWNVCSGRTVAVERFVPSTVVSFSLLRCVSVGVGAESLLSLAALRIGG